MERRAMTHRHPHHAKALAAFLMALTWLALGALPVQAANTVTTVTYVYTNAQGTPLAKANAQGTITARFTYRPYGAQQSGPTNDGPGYTGHVHDPATGLVYMQQRYYDPKVGRFISPDPVAPAPGNVFNIGRYTYANNNPYRFMDLFGAQACDDVKDPHDCIEATNYKPKTASEQTVTQDANIDKAVSKLARKGSLETYGHNEKAARFDENSNGDVTTTMLKVVVKVVGDTIKTTIFGAGGADSIGHSHPIGGSTIVPGPADSRVVNNDMPNNVIHDGSAIVIEKVKGQFRVRIIVDDGITRTDRRGIQKTVNTFQGAAQ